MHAMCLLMQTLTEVSQLGVIKSSGAGVTGVYESPNMGGVRNQTGSSATATSAFDCGAIALSSTVAC